MSKPTAEELARTVTAWNDALPGDDALRLFHKALDMAKQILEPPKPDAVAEMRSFRSPASVEREIACRWADTLEAAEKRVAELKRDCELWERAKNLMVEQHGGALDRVQSLESQRAMDGQRIVKLEQELASATGARDGAIHRVKVVEQQRDEMRDRIMQLEFQLKATQDANKLWAAKQPCDREEAAQRARAAYRAQEGTRSDAHWLAVVDAVLSCCPGPCAQAAAADREGLANQLRLSYFNGMAHGKWSELSAEWKDLWLRVADTAIATCCQSGPVEPIGAILTVMTGEYMNAHIFGDAKEGNDFGGITGYFVLFGPNCIIDHRKKPEGADGD